MPELVSDWQSRLVREVRRKAIHLSGLSVPLGLIFLGRTVTAWAIALALAASLILEAQRLRSGISLPVMREHEKTRVASHIYYMAGCLLAVLIFPKMIAVTAILFLALGDTVSGLAGSIIKNCDVRSSPAPAAGSAMRAGVAGQAHAGYGGHLCRLPSHRHSDRLIYRPGLAGVPLRCGCRSLCRRGSRSGARPQPGRQLLHTGALRGSYERRGLDAGGLEKVF